MNSATKAIHSYMKQGLNVLLYGYHGVGKTQMVLNEAKQLKLSLKYFSASTLDPWADVVGIPVPVEGKKHSGTACKQLQFIRPPDVEQAEIIFLDELNRAHSKVLNAVLEAIQFRRINGQLLPNLKMVWGAINPPDDIYQVNELDPVLVDRFHVHLQIAANPSVTYYTDKAGIAPHVAKALVLWWNRDLDQNLKKMISPRRLEYIGLNYMKGLQLQNSLPPTIKAPLQYLLRRIDRRNVLPFELTRGAIVDNQDEIIREMVDNVDVMLAVTERLLAWPDIMPQCVELFLAMTSELQARLIANKSIRTKLVNLGRGGYREHQELRPLADRLSAMGISVG